MRLIWFLILALSINLVIGIAVTSDEGSSDAIITPLNQGTMLNDTSLTTEGVSTLEQTTFGNAMGTGEFIWKTLKNGFVHLSVTDTGSGLTRLLNQGIIIFRALLNGVIVVVLYLGIVKGWPNI